MGSDLLAWYRLYMKARIVLALVLWPALPLSAQVGQQNNVHFAHFATGSGYSTTFTLINTGPTPASGVLQLNDASGTTRTEIQVTIPARGTNTVETGGGATLRTGWATFVGQGGNVAGVATFYLRERGVPVAAAAVTGSHPVQSATIPARVSFADEEYMSYAVANPGTSANAVSITIYSSEGVPMRAVLVHLEPREQRAQFLHQILPPEDADFFNGSIRVVSQTGAPFVAVGLTQIMGLITVLPVVVD